MDIVLTSCLGALKGRPYKYGGRGAEEGDALQVGGRGGYGRESGAEAPHSKSEAVIDGMVGQVAGEDDRQRSGRFAGDEGVAHLFQFGALFGAKFLFGPTCDRSLDSIPSWPKMKQLRRQSQQPIIRFSGLEQHRLFLHAFLDCLLLGIAVASITRGKVVARTV